MPWLIRVAIGARSLLFGRAIDSRSVWLLRADTAQSPGILPPIRASRAREAARHDWWLELVAELLAEGARFPEPRGRWQLHADGNGGRNGPFLPQPRSRRAARAGLRARPHAGAAVAFRRAVARPRELHRPSTPRDLGRGRGAGESVAKARPGRERSRRSCDPPRARARRPRRPRRARPLARRAPRRGGTAAGGPLGGRGPTSIHLRFGFALAEKRAPSATKGCWPIETDRAAAPWTGSTVIWWTSFDRIGGVNPRSHALDLPGALAPRRASPSGGARARRASDARARRQVVRSVAQRPSTATRSGRGGRSRTRAARLRRPARARRSRSRRTERRTPRQNRGVRREWRCRESNPSPKAVRDLPSTCVVRILMSLRRTPTDRLPSSPSILFSHPHTGSRA